MNTVYHNEIINATSDLNRFDTYTGVVERETTSGAIVAIPFDNGSSKYVYVYGSFNQNDIVLLGIERIYNDNRYPRAVVESILEEGVHVYVDAA